MTSKAEKRSDMNHTEEKLGTESLGSLMLSMGIPTLVAQMINLLYNIVDRVYIGQGVGREALTGLGLALPAITIVSAFSALAGAGGAPLAAIALGQGDREKAERITGNVFTLLCVFSAIVMLVFYAAQKPFLYLVGASDATYPYASEYLCADRARTESVYHRAGTVKDSDGLGAHRGRPEYRSGSDLYLCVPYGG